VTNDPERIARLEGLLRGFALDVKDAAHGFYKRSAPDTNEERFAKELEQAAESVENALDDY
jgi:pyruvate-formate lyase-activating enzyme